MLVLSEDEKPGLFFLRLLMDSLSADIHSHLLAESNADPR